MDDMLRSSFKTLIVCSIQRHKLQFLEMLFNSISMNRSIWNNIWQKSLAPLVIMYYDQQLCKKEEVDRKKDRILIFTFIILGQLSLLSIEYVRYYQHCRAMRSVAIVVVSIQLCLVVVILLRLAWKNLLQVDF